MQIEAEKETYEKQIKDQTIHIQSIMKEKKIIKKSNTLAISLKTDKTLQVNHTFSGSTFA